jgi:hypothetical protein
MTRIQKLLADHATRINLTIPDIYRVSDTGLHVIGIAVTKT